MNMKNASYTFLIHPSNISKFNNNKSHTNEYPQTDKLELFSISYTCSAEEEINDLCCSKRMQISSLSIKSRT